MPRSSRSPARAWRPPITDPEPELIARVVAGDGDALRQVVQARYARIRRWALLEAGATHLAEATVLEALIAVVRRIGNHDPEASLDGWLRALVRDCARDASHGDEPPPADVAGSTDRAVVLFAGLSARQREVLTLSIRDGLSAPEVAGELAIAPATAQALLHRARRTVRSQLLQELP